MARTITHPGDVVRPGVTIRRDGRMKWTVTRDGHMGVLFDEKGMKRGRWAAWSPTARVKGGIVAFTDDAEAAVDAVLATLPMSVKALAEETGATQEEIGREAAALEEEWAGEVPAFRVTPRRGLELTGAAVLAIREALAAQAAEEPAAETAPVPGEPEWRTLKGVVAPCFLYGTERDGGRWWPAGDRKRVTGEPLLITRLWTDRGMRYAEDVNGREIPLFGAAGKYWTAPAR